MNQKKQQTALIVGASRGLGWGLAREYLKRGWRVTATVRDARADTPLHQLQRNYPALEIEVVDIDVADQVASLHERLQGRRFDLLYLNAGVTNDPSETIGEVSSAEFLRVMTTNALSPLRFIETFLDCVDREGLIAAMSSELGSIEHNDGGGWEVYRASKAALNMLMKSLSARAGGHRTWYVVAPGWVRTDMGGAAAPLDIDTSIPRVADALESRKGSEGLVYVNYRNEILPW
ncbi:MAG: C-factor [Herbaspirillum frisingense]|uniref:C-factor n=1 Tax=Herbaspirillum frisingense TaxID=92645 RepID=A0A7V8JUL5_9BURK|nr:MAG: C-factor [Herbaspirillum frisingense]